MIKHYKFGLYIKIIVTNSHFKLFYFNVIQTYIGVVNGTVLEQQTFFK